MPYTWPGGRGPRLWRRPAPLTDARLPLPLCASDSTAKHSSQTRTRLPRAASPVGAPMREKLTLLSLHAKLKGVR